MDPKQTLLLAGDSISFGYGPLVQARIGAICEVTNLPEIGGTSSNLLAHLDAWLIRPQFDFIHLNCGLHDLARDRDAMGPRVAIASYEANLKEILRRLRDETRSRLVWATTTPVIDERHAARKGFDRREEDVRTYNAASLRVAEDAGLPVNDLHRVLMAAGPEKCVGPDGVHMTEDGYRVLADAVSGFFREFLAQR